MYCPHGGSSNEEFSKFVAKPKISSLAPAVAERVFFLLGITETDDRYVRIIDSAYDDSLILVHYISFSPTVKHVRGVVVDTLRGEIVCCSFPLTEEQEVVSDKLPGSTQINTSDVLRVCPAYEGTILRVFWWAPPGAENDAPNIGEWFISSHRKLDGTKSRWAGPPFGTLFYQIWGEDNDLDSVFHRDKCYILLLSHRDSRLVCNVSESRIYHVGTCVKVDVGGRKILAFSSETHLQEPHRLTLQETFRTEKLSDIVPILNSTKWYSSTGVLVTYVKRVGSGEVDHNLVPFDRIAAIKYMNSEYVEKRRIRGKEPNIQLRYLQIFRDEMQPHSLRELEDLYPDKAIEFANIQRDLTGLPYYIGKLFLRRYSKNNRRFFLRLPPEEHYIVEATYKNYNSNLSLEENIKSTLNTSNARQLFLMISRMRNEEPN